MKLLQLSRPGLLATFLMAAAPAAMAVQSIASQNLEDEAFFAGLVIAVDPGRGVLTAEEAGSDRRMTFQIPAEAEILKDEGAIRIEAVQVGDPIAVEFRESARGPIVTSVKVITSPRED
ncbi:MAG: hypothetical protein ACRD21_13485 [Vicinamibacteria bacterium]